MKEKYKTGEMIPYWKGKRQLLKTKRKMEETWARKIQEGYDPGIYSRGKKQSKKTIDKRKETIRNNPNILEIWRENAKKNLNSPEVILKRKLTFRKTLLRPEIRNKFVESMRLAGLASRKARPSSIEISIKNIFDKCNIDYEQEKRIGKYRVDFYLDSGLIIECDGEYWHRDKKYKDRARDINLRKQDFSIIRLKEKDIKYNPKLALLSGISRLENKWNHMN